MKSTEETVAARVPSFARVCTPIYMNVGDPRKIDAVRALVARMHDGPASVVDYEGNGFCWGFSLVGSAHPHTWQHGGVVDVGDSSACVAACATYPDICAERFVRRSLWESRSNGRYKDVVNGSSHANTADNDFYTPGGSVCSARAAGVAQRRRASLPSSLAWITWSYSRRASTSTTVQC